MPTTHITNAGRAEIIKMMTTAGKKFNFRSLKLGNANAIDIEKISNPIETIMIASTNVTPQDNSVIHITALADSAADYQVTEIGVIINYVDNTDEILLATITDGGRPLASKTASQALMLAFDLYIKEIPADKIVISGPGERLNLNMSDVIATMGSSIVFLQTTVNELLKRVDYLEKGLKP